MSIILCYTTIDSEDKANDLAKSLVEEKLIACANIYMVHSIYNWENKTQNEKEWRIDMKTRESLQSKLEQRIEALHSYEVPAIITIPIEANAAFFSWVDKMTRS